MLPLLEIAFLCALAAAPDDEERALAAGIKSGDAKSFRRFFDRHHDAALRYLAHRRVDASAAEDIVQQAFVTIWERRDRIRIDGSLKALLFRIAYTRALNHFRDTARFSGDDPADLSHGVDPGDPAHERLVRERVAMAVAALPERRRAVFELCMLEGFTYREAADALEVSIKTVENQMGHALKAVRLVLQPLRDEISGAG